MALHNADTGRMRGYPKEPYPALSVLGAALLALALLWFGGLYGLGMVVGEPPPAWSAAFIALATVSVALPFVGIRALFGNHPFSLVVLAVLGGAHLVFGYLIQSVPDARMGAMAFGPALLVLAVATFGWWKWTTIHRRAGPQATDDLG